MNKQIVENYCKVAHNENLKLLLNVGGQLITGDYLDIENADFSARENIFETVMDRINLDQVNSDILVLTNVQIRYSEDSYESLTFLTISMSSIDSISIP